MNLLELTATAECLLIASCPLVRITLSNYVQNIKALIDSSSEVNIMPYRIVRQIGIPTSFIDITINTIGGSSDFLTSYASNVKVRVGSIVIPIDFLLSNVEEGGIKNIVILGRPFKRRARIVVTNHDNGR
jgi:hypothetical protein